MLLFAVVCCSCCFPFVAAVVAVVVVSAVAVVADAAWRCFLCILQFRTAFSKEGGYCAQCSSTDLLCSFVIER